MKKRICSLLLLVAMLLTGIPVMAVSAEEAAPVTNAVQDYDYHDLYVQDGLKALHTAFDADDETVKATNDGNGKWLNRVEGGYSAALGGGYWRRTANGGIGYDLYRGAADNAAGDNYVDAPTVNGAGTNTYSNTIFFQFGADAYAHEDFTVEYVAEYLPIYTRLTGETADIGSKVVGEAYTFNEAGMTGTSGLAGTAVDTLGYLGAFAGVRDGKDGVRGRVRWIAASYLSWNNNCADEPSGTRHYNTTLGWNTGDEIFHKRGGIYTFAIMADENTADGKNEAVYTLLHDRAVLRTSTVASYSFTKADGSTYQNLDYTVDSTNNFQLSYCLPTDFYVVRMYHKTLSAAEQAQNHAVDVLEYYNLSIDKTVAQKNIGALALMLANVGFEKDASVKAATAAELQAKLDAKGYSNYNYVTDGLTAFFSTNPLFAENSVDLAAGKWTDFFGGNVASLKGTTWELNENGFLGFNIYRGQADENGDGYVDGAPTNNYYNSTGNPITRLDFGIALLPKGDFTVDYLAEYKPIYTLLTGTTADNITEDKIVGEAFNFNGSAWANEAYSGDRRPVDTLGYLDGWTSSRDGTAGGCTRGGVRFGVSNRSTGGDTAMGLASHGLNLFSDTSFRPRGAAHGYSFTRDEDIENGNNQATYAIWQDAVALKTSTRSDTSLADFNVDDNGTFYFSDSLPTDFFAVRIYDRALSEAELLQNAVADKALFYGVTLPEDTFESVAKLTEVNAALPAPSSSMSAQEIAAYRVSFEEYYAAISMYVTDGLTAFFSTNPLFAENSVDLAAGKWTDFFGGNVASLEGTTWRLNDTTGFLGFNIYRGQANQDRTNYQDDAVTNNYYNSTGNPVTRLNLGIALLPTGDFTVDYTAEYKSIYTLLTGTTVETASDDKVVGAAYDFSGSSWSLEPYSGSRRPVDTIGYLDGWTMSRDGTQSCSRGGVRFGVSNRSTGGDTAMGMAHGLDLLSDTSFRPRGAAHGYAFTRDEDTANGNNKATYSIWQDAVALRTSTRSDTSLADFTVDDNGTFYLSDCLPTDFFAIRIYDRALTEAELARNMLADKVLFYGVEVPDGVMENVVKVASLNAKIPAPSSDMSAQEIAALRLEIEQLLVPELPPLYVTDGLVAFFATQGSNSMTVNLSTGTWTDFYTGKQATFTGGGWYVDERGGVGFNIYRGMIDANGVYQDSSTYNNNTNMIRLDLSMDLLPDADYTVEYTAEYHPIYTVDTEGKIVGEMYDLNPTKMDANELGWRGRGAIDQLGVLASWTGMRDATFESSAPRGSVRWMIYKNPNIRYYGKVTDDNNRDYYNYYMQPKTGETVFHKHGGIFNFAIVRDETTDDGKNEATYSLFHDGVLHKSATVAKTVFTLNGTEDYNVDFAVDEPGSFFLSDALPISFYSLRIYSRALTEAEQKQNRMSDMIDYYGVAIPKDFLEDEERYAYVLSLCETLDFAKDETTYTAVKTTLQTAVIGEGNQLVTLIVDGKESTSVVYGDSYVLPMPDVGTENLMAWHKLDENGEKVASYAPGATVTLTEAETSFRALTVSAPETKYGISVKAMPGGSFGMRFTATVEKADILALMDEFGARNVQVSMLITPMQYTERAGGFTREAIRDFLVRNGKDPAKAFVEIPSNGFYYVDETICTMAGTIYNFTDVTVENNLSFAAIGVIDIDTDNDGYIDRTVYGTYTNATCCSPKKAVESIEYMGIELNDTQRKWVKEFLNRYDNNTYGGNKTVAQQRDEISSAFTEAMNTTVNYVVHPFAEGEVDEKYAHIQAISFDGLTMNGKKTRIFAYIGLPEGASADNPVPAMVLVHGGGGRSYIEWVRLWNERGYAAIAMETVGAFPTSPGALKDSDAVRAFPDYILDVIDEDEYVLAPDRVMSTSFKEVDQQWQYHGLSAVILSHNVLRQNAAVDSSRIGAVGVSWGGTMVSQVIGYDTRLAFAIPIYGTAYLSEPARSFISASYVDALWAAERRLNNFKNPIMWFAWADDNNFIMDSYNKSYLQSLGNNEKNALVVLADWRHGHSQAWDKEHSYAFADSICFPDKAEYAYFTALPNGQNAASTVVLPAGATNVSVRYHYLTEPMQYKTFEKHFLSSWLVEYWKTDSETLTIDPLTGKITGTIPEEVRSYYISVRYTVDGRELEISSSFITIR